MTICLGKSLSFDLPCVFFVNVYQFVCVCVSITLFCRWMWDLIVLVPERCLIFILESLPISFAVGEKL